MAMAKPVVNTQALVLTGNLAFAHLAMGNPHLALPYRQENVAIGRRILGDK